MVNHNKILNVGISSKKSWIKDKDKLVDFGATRTTDKRTQLYTPYCTGPALGRQIILFNIKLSLCSTSDDNDPI